MPIHVLVATEVVLSPALESAWLARLPAARRERLGRWPDARDRQRSLVGHRLLGRALVRIGGSEAMLDALHYAPSGRPRLAGAAADVAFSLSHCRGRVVCAVSTDGPVGIDVEAVDDNLRADDFPSYLGAAERAWAGDDARRFCALWTRKEAVAKAAGDAGLAAMRTIELDGGSASAAHGGQRWSTREVPVGPGHVAHLAHAAPATQAPAAHEAQTAPAWRAHDGAGPVITIEHVAAVADDPIL